VQRLDYSRCREAFPGKAQAASILDRTIYLWAQLDEILWAIGSPG
jgi:hypothetical protein